MIVGHTPVLQAIRNSAVRLDGDQEYQKLMTLVGERPFVLLGESTHGTHEFYATRAEITRRLISELGFDAVAVEADWPDAFRLNRFVQGTSTDSLDDAFGDFQRFPAWMWCNRPVREFIRWLQDNNARLPAGQRSGFYGLDLYSLYRSAEAVVNYLEQVDPEQAGHARRLYSCLDHVSDPQEYGYEAALGLRPSCREAAADILVQLSRKATGYVAADEASATDEQFHAERNAHVVLSAEHYYRAMFGARSNTWNLRDSHMVETLFALHRHLRRQGRKGRIVVWAHNSHLGDARATGMGERGEHNVGQLVRQQAGADNALLVGFTTCTGHVTAARDWNGVAERRWVRPALEDSCEDIMRRTRLDRFFLPMCGLEDLSVSQALAERRLQRAIGVIYRPETELASHYFPASLSAQFDALFHMDETTALEPLETTAHWQRHEPPDTYPFGI